MPNVADVVVIGAGVIGASVAFHLARAGVRNVVLVEKRFVACGATGKSSGLVRMHYDNKPECVLAWTSFGYFSNWSAVVGGDCGFRRTGFLYVVPRELTDHLRANVGMQQSIGIHTEVISAREALDLVPSLYVEDLDVLAYEPESGYADPTSATNAFIDAAKESGARLFQDTAVTGIGTQSGRICQVETENGKIPCAAVVNAAGAWAPHVAAMVGVELPIQGWRHQIMYVRRPTELAAVHPAVIDDVNRQYFRSETGQLTLVGLEDGNELGADPDHYREWVDADYLLRAGERLTFRIPAMTEAQVVRGQAGCDGLTPDQHAIIDRAGPENFYVVAGFSGRGFKLAPAVGLCVAELITKGSAETVDITPFRLSRFAEGRPFVVKYPYRHTWT
jgi:sarcosine oxidase subunit beta